MINFTEDELKEILRSFKYGSYTSNGDPKQLPRRLKIIKKQVLESISRLSSTYSHDQELIIELFKIIVSKIDKMSEEKQDELAKYFVENINQEVKN